MTDAVTAPDVSFLGACGEWDDDLYIAWLRSQPSRVPNDPDDKPSWTPRGPLTTRERAEVKGISWKEVLDMAQSATDANVRCRDRELRLKHARVFAQIRRHMALLWGESSDGDPWIPCVPDGSGIICLDEALHATPSAREETRERQARARAEAHAYMAADDCPLVQCMAYTIERLTARFPRCSWSRGYQWYYTRAKQERDWWAMARMAVTMGLVAMGPYDEETRTLAHGPLYGVATLEEAVVVSLEVLWRLLTKYQPRTGRKQSPLAWVRTMFHRVLEDHRRNIHTDDEALVQYEWSAWHDVEEQVGNRDQRMDRLDLRDWMDSVLGREQGRLAWLVLIDKYAITEAAAILGIPERRANYWWNGGGKRGSIAHRLRSAWPEWEGGTQ